ncbi:MarR family transcriptional regulator [Sinorhizobium meliloti]|uniref:MarR family transcriptional regulator n=1 Tax=Rhizobium meliloti TaxID=382 RepID=UPI0030A8955C
MQSHNRLIWHLVKQIVENAFPEETAASRLQQVAVLLTINALQNQPEPLTTQRLGEIYGLNASQTHKLVTRLVERGLVIREQIHNRLGRGHAFALRLVETPELKILRDAILNEGN